MGNHRKIKFKKKERLRRMRERIKRIRQDRLSRMKQISEATISLGSSETERRRNRELGSSLCENAEDGGDEAGSSYCDVPMQTAEASTIIYAHDTSAANETETLVLVIKEEAEDADDNAAEETSSFEVPVEPEVDCERVESTAIYQGRVEDPLQPYLQAVPKADPDHSEQLKTALDPLVTHLKEQYEYICKKRLQENESYKKKLDECHRVIRLKEEAHKRQKTQIEKLKKENVALLEEIMKLKQLLSKMECDDNAT